MTSVSEPVKPGTIFRFGAAPFGARGVGEPSVTAVGAAPGNVVADAIGVRVFDSPLTPEKVLCAIKKAGFEIILPE